MSEMSSEPREMKRLEARPQYALSTRILIELYQQGELPAIEELMVEPTYGYAGRVLYRDGAVRMFRGSDVGLNSSGARQTAGDKGYTKYFLQALGYHTPPGKVFLLPHYVEMLDKSLAKYDFHAYTQSTEIDRYIATEIGYPCYLKPNEGSQGKGVRRCLNRQDVEQALAHYQQERVAMVLVEQAIPWPDYRVVVFDGRVVLSYLRTPLTITGDGVSKIRALLQQKHEQFVRLGRTAVIDSDDPRIIQRLARRQYYLDTILPAGEQCPLQDVSNLSAGGDATDYSELIHPRWQELCIEVSAAMGLRLCGVDLACEAIEQSQGAYSILELNDAPGLANYAALGNVQYQRVRQLYKDVFAKAV
ncbi:MAG TPA: hypothetical protein VKX46_10690 [Ktedonobacteraceae bacterium]|nr:hypothetical protein [Ktedonobacteraceae bacterium]